MKRKKKKRFQFSTVFAVILGLGALVSVVLVWQLFNKEANHIISVDNTPRNNVLSTQEITTTLASSTTLKSTQQTTKKDIVQTETTGVETIEGAETRTTNRQLSRLDTVGNSGLEFDTLDEATEYAEKMVSNQESLAMLRHKGYSGYAIRSVRWTNNTVTYTIEWR